MRYSHFFIIAFILLAGLFFANQVFAWPVCDATNDTEQCDDSSTECLLDDVTSGSCMNLLNEYTMPDPNDMDCSLTQRICDGLIADGYNYVVVPRCSSGSCSSESLIPVGTQCPLNVPGPYSYYFRTCSGDAGFIPPPPPGSSTNNPKFTFTITPDGNGDGVGDNLPYSRWNDTFTYNLNLHNEYDGFVNFNFTSCPLGAVCNINQNYYFNTDPDDDNTVIPFTVSAPSSVLPDKYVISITANSLYDNMTPRLNIRYTQPFEFILRNNLTNVATCDAAFFANTANVPDTVNAGQPFEAKIRMNNPVGATNKTWTNVFTSANDGEHKLQSRSATNNTTWGTNRVWLTSADDQNVTPGESVTFTYVFTAPLAPNTYTFAWRMIEELVEEFPGGTCSKIITVQNPPAAPTVTLSGSSSGVGLARLISTITGATSCTRTSAPTAIPAWNTNVGIVGQTQDVNGLPAGQTTFTLDCVNGTSPHTIATANVTPPLPNPPAVTLTGFSPAVGQATLNYTIANAVTCLRTSSPGVAAWNSNGGITTGSQTVNTAIATDFTLACTNPDGTTSKMTNVIPLAAGLFRLNVDKEGGGRVTSSDGHIDCGSGCISDFYDYTDPSPNPFESVTLTAQPNSSFWIFKKWNGGPCNNSTNVQCIVTMSSNQSMEAVFTPKPFIYREF